MSDGYDEILYVSDEIDINDVVRVATNVLTGAFAGVGESVYPGFNHIFLGTGLPPIKELLDEFEQELGVRPLRELEVDALFDPVTGHPLERVH